ncbi:MAG: ComF family protein [Candidatus Saccharicenans sp.]
MKPIELLDRLFWPVKITVFPSRCPLCGQLLEKPGDKIVCSQCLSQIEIHHGPVCEICGRFLYHQSGEKAICLKCYESPPVFSQHRSLGPYAGALKEIIILFKYRGYEVLSKTLSLTLYNNFQKGNLFSGIDFIVPIPLHRQKYKTRGFNQAELLTKNLSILSGRPWLKNILVKIKNTPAQVSLEAQEREKNLKGAFAIRKPEKIEGQTLLLVDDVFTTGSTINECARILRQNGAREVRALTIAQA